MTIGSWYLALKAAHLISVFTWVSGTLLAAWALRVGQTGVPLEPAARKFMVSIARWDRMVTSPALVLAWAFGLTLAKLGGWFPAPWLLIKLVLALAIAAVHGYLVGRLRKAIEGTTSYGPAWLPIAVLVFAATAIALAITKPF